MTTGLILLSTVSYRGEEITAPPLRALSALPAADLRRGCGTGRLAEDLWPDEQPENPVNAVRILVSRPRPRSRLGAGVRVLLHAGASREKAWAGDHVGALAQTEAGLALWDSGGDGSCDGGGDGQAVPADPVAGPRAERATAHRALLRHRALGLARTGRREEAVGPPARGARTGAAQGRGAAPGAGALRGGDRGDVRRPHDVRACAPTLRGRRRRGGRPVDGAHPEASRARRTASAMPRSPRSFGVLTASGTAAAAAAKAAAG